MKKVMGSMIICTLSLISMQVIASSYTLPQSQDTLIGNIIYTKAGTNNVVELSKQYDVGFNALQSANPQLNLNASFASHTSVQIPTEHLLPDLPRKGIIVNLPEMRMYYFQPGTHTVYTYPVGIGKMGNTIPIQMTAVTRKKINPDWIPPEDIREFDLKTQGIVVPQVFPPGPNNPLGPYAIYMRIPTYLIHSTIFPESVGKRASFGCIRMYEFDIKSFFPTIQPGMPVAIINSPTKVGWQGDHLYLEAYQPLEEHSNDEEANLSGIVHMITQSTKTQLVLVDWQQVSYIAQERDGIPHDIAFKIKQ